MKAEIICIGTELLLGQIVDTNAAYLARELATLGIDLFYKATVGDNLGRVTATLKQAWERADLLLISGGLGPTQDDLTREGIAHLLNEELELKEEAWEQIRRYFQKTGRPMAKSNRRQAQFPKSARVVENFLGTAPGVMIEKNNRIIIAMPGVPSELQGMWETSVRPFLKQKMASRGGSQITSRMIKMVGIGESAMEERIIDLIKRQTNPTIAPYAGRGEVYLRVTAKGVSEQENQKLIEETTTRIKEFLGEFIYGYDAINLEMVIGRQLLARGWNLAVAESCTGGLIAHRITNIPGSSDYFLGGVNCYSNKLKSDIVGVPESVIAKHGAVSPETAAAMAEGIRTRTGADVGLAVTGIAGPGGGSAEKPVGLVYLALALPGEAIVEKRVFPYDRIGNKEASAQTGLTMLWQRLDH